jgi:hypothetical protein
MSGNMPTDAIRDKTRMPLAPHSVRNFLETIGDYGCAAGRWTLTPEAVKELSEAWLERNDLANRLTAALLERDQARKMFEASRANALEEAAKVADALYHNTGFYMHDHAAKEAAACIRALKSPAALPAEGNADWPDPLLMTLPAEGKK